MLLFLLTLGFPIQGESLRGNVTDLVDLSSDARTSLEYPLKVNELLAVEAGGKADFLQGVEVSLRIPSSLSQSGTSFLVMIYKAVSPAVRTGVGNYRALEAGHAVLPARSRIYLELPFRGYSPAYSAAVTPLVQDTPLLAGELPLLITLIPMSKGAPPVLDTESFQLKVTPVWGEVGKVEISLSGDPVDPDSLILWIDDQQVRFSGQTLTLSAGVHKLLAQAEGFREISRNFAVPKAQTVRLDLPFEHLRSTVLFEAPEDSQIFLDGEKITFPQNGPLSLDDGEHSVMMILGDYRISKRVRIVPGKDYKISLFLDILLQEY